MQRMCQTAVVVGCALVTTTAVAGPAPSQGPMAEPADVRTDEAVIRGAILARFELLVPLAGYSGELVGGGGGLDFWLEWPQVSLLTGLAFRSDFVDGDDFYRQIAHHWDVYWLPGGENFTPVLGSGLSLHLVSASVAHEMVTTFADGLFQETTDGTSNLFGFGGSWFATAGLLAFRRNKLRLLGTVSYSVGPDVFENPQLEHAIHVSMGVLGGG